ncbi:50S ribosomal protein L9 [Novacetimonas pomaceti]|uniref:Large ribosomal subunit protein bL9 n=1 Tax=Novacetimonas pomaceti TaxID=2021998 RepID=A0A318QVT7_9PROT|nr:50S ribosomal protein L9 [Novacetimonas pomaceti]MBV1834690.1 50S ribosomal protein L9 [Novacetimonas pomaceti]PYD47625.1 50S ribosomal protein L9 [Novacetimonas pomaceti]PYD76943.1 50S ribosomal protein L9 [Novacetimonas pomaceti]
MSAVELILLQRVEKLGQMGEIVTVKPGYARNFLLPQGKAIRANAHNRERFERERVQLEAQNLKRREEAERLSERMHGLSVVLIRQAGDSGSLYGSVTTRDIAEALTQAGLTVSRSQVILPEPIKQLGVYEVRVALHPEVSMQVSVNVARSEEEAERQARGEEIGAERDDDASGFVEEAVEVEAAPEEEAPVAATEEHPAA